MSSWFAALLGVVQGLTEFLPISSTAHLRILPALLGQEDPGAAFTAVVQLGTLAAVVAYFARDLINMVHALVRQPRTKSKEAQLVSVQLGTQLFFAILLGTIPIGICGIVFKPLIVGAARSLWVVAGALVMVALLMIAVERHARSRRHLLDLTWVDALLIGLAQAAALIPGVSRSGATMVCALWLGFRRDDSARFSFLLSIPAIFAAAVFEFGDAMADLGANAWLSLSLATLTAALSGYAAIHWLLKFLQTRTLLSFAVYRIALGGAIVALIGAGIV